MTRTLGIGMSVALIAAACTKAADEEDRKPAAKPADLRVEVGDCAGATATFVSGPRPRRGGAAFASLRTGLDDGDLQGGILGDQIGELQGGFGYGTVDLGPAGGSGVGTIGIGRYGTIGHGPGGGRRGMSRAGQVPLTRIGNAEVTGGLDKNIVRRYIRRKLPQIQYCYEKRLLVAKDLRGTVDVDFTMDAGGLVPRATGSGMDPEVATCVAGVIDEIEFPKPKGGAVVQARYPFHFGPVEHVAYLKPSKELDEALGKLGKLEAAPKAPSPLRGHEPALTTCLGKQPAGHGVAVIELDIDAAGSIESSTVHGLGGELAACVAAATKQITVKGGTPGVQRCPVAFGSMPIDRATSVSITSKGLFLADKQLADPAALAAAASSPQMKLAPLYQALSPPTTQEDAPPPVVEINGPIVVRPTGDTPMKEVTRVLVTIAMAGRAPELATTAETGWRLLRDTPLPLVPVARPDAHGAGVAPLGAVISMLVRKDSIWIGTSGAGAAVAPTTLPSGPDLTRQLEATLGGLGKSPPFAGRRDLEIAAEDDVPYGQLVAVVEATTRAGFADWEVGAAQSLSAAPAP